jgi:Putative transposase/Transposase zinc-binding domain
MKAACKHAASARQSIELADIFRVCYRAYAKTHCISPVQWKAARAIVQCRTAALGGHCDACLRCGYLRYRYHSCRNRNCPKCGSLAKARWLESRQQELLPTPYYHNVFTLPHELNGLILYSEGNRRALLGLLFRSAAETLLAFGRNNLDGKLGFTLVLHTWTQQLQAHFHVHALIAGGALAEDGSNWTDAGNKFLFPVRALSRVFRGKYVNGVENLVRDNQLDLPPQLATSSAQHQLLRRKAWVVYSKRPFAGPERLLDYLGRYTHRVAISNHRLLSLQDGQVEFAYRDRRDGDRKKTKKLPAEEFIHRFLKHVLPSGFMRIRHYGFLGNRTKKKSLAQCRQLLGAATPESVKPKTLTEWILLWTGEDVSRCPQCGHTELVIDEIPRPRHQTLHSAQTNDFW